MRDHHVAHAEVAREPRRQQVSENGQQRDMGSVDVVGVGAVDLVLIFPSGRGAPSGARGEAASRGLGPRGPSASATPGSPSGAAPPKMCFGAAGALGAERRAGGARRRRPGGSRGDGVPPGRRRLHGSPRVRLRRRPLNAPARTRRHRPCGRLRRRLSRPTVRPSLRPAQILRAPQASTNDESAGSSLHPRRLVARPACASELPPLDRSRHRASARRRRKAGAVPENIRAVAGRRAPPRRPRRARAPTLARRKQVRPTPRRPHRPRHLSPAPGRRVRPVRHAAPRAPLTHAAARRAAGRRARRLLPGAEHLATRTARARRPPHGSASSRSRRTSRPPAPLGMAPPSGPGGRPGVVVVCVVFSVFPVTPERHLVAWYVHSVQYSV